MIRLVQPEIGKEEITEVKKVIKSGWLIQGDKVKKFEQTVAEYLNVKNAIAVSSATAGLHLSLIALGIKPGNEVIVPSATFPATANVIELVGAKPVFVDVDIDTYNIDCQQLQKTIDTIANRNNLKAIIPVHQFGQSTNMDEIVKIAKKYNLKIIEDAACALGSKYKNYNCGTMGDVGIFSFHPRKIITTAEGGVIVSNDNKISRDLRTLRNHGITDTQGKLDFIYPGLNYRMTEIQAAIGIIQMKKLEEIIKKRRKLAKLYNLLLKDMDWIKVPQEKDGYFHTYQSYVILLDTRINRNNLILKLKQKGIETTIGTYAIHMLSYYCKKYGYKPADFPNAKMLFERGLALPLHYRMDENDVRFVVKNILKVIKDKKL